MKSKAEIIEALKCHMGGDCSECSYREGWHTCNPTPERGLFADILALLNESDFEVVKEVLDKSLILDWEHYSEDDDYYRTKRLSAKDARGTVYELAFDAKGNIL